METNIVLLNTISATVSMIIVSDTLLYTIRKIKIIIIDNSYFCCFMTSFSCSRDKFLRIITLTITINHIWRQLFLFHNKYFIICMFGVYLDTLLCDLTLLFRKKKCEKHFEEDILWLSKPLLYTSLISKVIFLVKIVSLV